MPEVIDEVEDSLEVQEKQTTVDKATDTQTDNKLYEDIKKGGENLDIYQTVCESSEGVQIAATEQQPPIISQNGVLIADLAMLPAGNHKQK